METRFIFKGRFQVFSDNFLGQITEAGTDNERMKLIYNFTNFPENRIFLSLTVKR